MIVEKEELSIYEVESLHKELLKEFENGSVLMDMKNVNKVDMSVIQLLISVKQSCEESSKKFELQNVNEEVKKILQNAACDFLIGADDE